MTDNKTPWLKFLGLQLNKTEKGFGIYETVCLPELKSLAFDAYFSFFCSSIIEITWLLHARPDTRFEVLRAAQVNKTMFKLNISTYIKSLNTTIICVLDNDLSINFSKSEKITSQKVFYTDASFSNNFVHTILAYTVRFLSKIKKFRWFPCI